MNIEFKCTSGSFWFITNKWITKKSFTEVFYALFWFLQIYNYFQTVIAFYHNSILYKYREILPLFIQFVNSNSTTTFKMKFILAAIFVALFSASVSLTFFYILIINILKLKMHCKCLRRPPFYWCQGSTLKILKKSTTASLKFFAVRVWVKFWKKGIPFSRTLLY